MQATGEDRDRSDCPTSRNLPSSRKSVQRLSDLPESSAKVLDPGGRRRTRALQSDSLPNPHTLNQQGMVAAVETSSNRRCCALFQPATEPTPTYPMRSGGLVRVPAALA